MIRPRVRGPSPRTPALLYAQSVETLPRRYASPNVACGSPNKELPDQPAQIPFAPFPSCLFTAGGISSQNDERTHGDVHLLQLGTDPSEILPEQDQDTSSPSADGSDSESPKHISTDFSFWQKPGPSGEDFGQPKPFEETSGKGWPSLVSEVGSERAKGHPSLRFRGCVNNHPVSILLECGAQRDCINTGLCDRHLLFYLPPQFCDVPINLTDGTPKNCACGILDQGTIHIGTYTDSLDLANELHGEDLILGMPWLFRLDPLVHCRSRKLTLTIGDKQHVLGEDNSPHAHNTTPMISETL